MKAAAIHERTNSAGELWFDVKDFADPHLLHATKPTKDDAEEWCQRNGFKVMGVQPQLFTERGQDGHVRAVDPNDGLTPFQRKIMNRHAVEATIRKHGS